jgi:hypothetical protein
MVEAHFSSEYTRAIQGKGGIYKKKIANYPFLLGQPGD